MIGFRLQAVKRQQRSPSISSHGGPALPNAPAIQRSRRSGIAANRHGRTRASALAALSSNVGQIAALVVRCPRRCVGFLAWNGERPRFEGGSAQSVPRHGTFDLSSRPNPCHRPAAVAGWRQATIPPANRTSVSKINSIMRVAGCILAMCAALAAEGGAQERLSGDWSGYWAQAGDTMPVTLHVSREAATGRYTGTFDAERLRVSGIPFDTVRVDGCCGLTMVLRGDRTTTRFTGTFRSDSLSGAFREGERDGRFAFARSRAEGPTFREQDIRFANGPVNLAGSLLLPLAGDSLPAVVFLHGSGAEGRWASRFLAAQFASHGIAALIFDKRGVGGSSGDWRVASLEDLAGDAAAAVARLTDEPRIDRRRIGIHGHSQGGTLAPLVAAMSDAVSFVIGSAAAGLPTDSTEIFSILNSVYPRAATAEDSVMARSYVGELVAVAYHGQPRHRLDSLVAVARDRRWFFAPPPADNSYWSFSRIFGQYQPVEWWARVTVPVLLIYGSQDHRVPAAESAARISATLIRATPDADVTVRIFRDADHTFRLPPGPSEWPVTAPDYIDTLLNWLALR